MTRVFYGNSKHDGISITYIKSRKHIEISGWYDGCVGIEGDSMPLGKFLRELGVTVKDVQKELEDGKPA